MSSPWATLASNRTSRTCSGRRSISSTAPSDRIERELDDNEQAQRRSQKEQDGSEIRSVELERLTAEGQTLIERSNSMEFFRDQAADQFERHTGSSWRPRSGSMVNHRTLTSAMIDSRDFLAAKRRAETEVLLPAGPKIAFTGGLDFNDHRLIWDRLDKVHAKHPDMVLLHGGSPKGAERIAARWADHRKVPQIAFKPDWTKHAKAAPFKRNDQMLDVLPIGVMVFPGTGIQDNLADKARSSASRSGSSARAARERCQIAADKFLLGRIRSEAATGLGEHERPSPHKISPKGAGQDLCNNITFHSSGATIGLVQP